MKVSIIRVYEEFVRKKKKKSRNFDNHDSPKITFDVRPGNTREDQTNLTRLLKERYENYETIIPKISVRSILL